MESMDISPNSDNEKTDQQQQEKELDHEDVLLEALDDNDSGDSGSGGNTTPKGSPREQQAVDPSTICQACLIGDVDEVRTCLQNANAANCLDQDGRTPLHAAAYSDEPQIVQMLIAAGALVNAKDRFLLTPLHRACSSKAHEVLTQLIAVGADLNRKDKFWQTPLHIAANSGAVTCVRFLLKAGALSDERDCHGRTPLHLAAALAPRIESAGDICKLLIEKGHASLTVRDNLGRHPIHYAAASGNPQTFKVLCEAGARLDVSDSELFMPIHCAAISGSSVVLSQIIRAGLLTQPSFSDQIEAPAQGDQTPLHLGAAGGHVDCVQALLQNGADPEMQNASGATPVHYSAGSVVGRDSMSLLMKASSQPHRLATMPDNQGRTPLHFAAFFGNVQRLKALLRSSLDGTENCTCQDDIVCVHRAQFALQKDQYGLEPMHYAASQGHAQICSVLVKFYQFDTKNVSGPLARSGKECGLVFPLLLSTSSGSVECTRVLLESLPKTVKNLDTFEDTLGRNCFHAACYSGSPDLVDLLAGSRYFADFNRGCAELGDWAPIHFVAAAKRRRFAADCVKILVNQAGDLLDPNQCDKLGRSALMISAGMDDGSNGCVFNALISLANADPLTLDAESRSLLHYAAGNAGGSSGGGGGNGPFERCAISRVLASPSDAAAPAPGNNGETSQSGTANSCLLSPADAGELVDLALVGPQCNPLHIACYHGLSANLAALVPLMPSLISSADEFGWTPLHYAAALKNSEAAAECVQLLLAGGANVVAKECRYGWTPLHVAAYYGVASTVRILVDYVANSSESQLASTYTSGRRALLPEPATFINARDRQLRTPLHLAISSRHRESVCVLLHRGADFRAKDKNRRSALHRAVYIGDTELVQWLSKAEPQSLFQKDAGLGRNVLHLAVLRGNADVVEVIANACPKLVLACDSDGISPLHLAAWRNVTPPTSFASSASNDDPILSCLIGLLEPEWIEKILKNYRTNVKLSPFHCAAVADRALAFEKLKDAFFKGNKDEESENLPNFKDTQGRTLFHAVFASGSLGIFQSLVQSLKLPTVSQQLTIKDKTKRRWTPIQYAISHGRISLLRECRELLGEPGLVDLISEPKTLRLAVSKGHEVTSLFLLEAYCNVNGEDGVQEWVQGALNLAIKRGLARLTEALLKLGINPLVNPPQSKSKAPVFAACATEGQVACLALAISHSNRAKECWGVRQTTQKGAGPQEKNETEESVPISDFEAMDQFMTTMSPPPSSKNDTSKSPTGRKSSASGFSDDGEFF